MSRRASGDAAAAGGPRRVSGPEMVPRRGGRIDEDGGGVDGMETERETEGGDETVALLPLGKRAGEDVLADMTALQREVDELRERYRRGV